MIGIMQEARRLHNSCHGSTPVRIKISTGIAQERTTGSIYPKRIGKIEVETNKSDGFCRSNFGWNCFYNS
ncbi:MAG: hypothetical protein RLZZ417_1232 [Bacteroidota bacterium]|jgi:hypothetical protein